VHAGWRGLVAGAIGAAVARLAGLAPDGHSGGALSAWIGPSIGPCCYEVGDEVAEAIASAAGPSAVVRRPEGRPHVDLQAAARLQLAAHGVRAISSLALCTRCHPDLLWSYRRDGAAAGRNLAFVWRRDERARS